MNKRKIKYVNWGLANIYEDGTIEINKRLKDKPEILNYVINHELGHKKGFDLSHEFDYKPQLLPLIWFTITHFSSWIDFLPIQKRKKIWFIDYNLLILYGLCIFLVAFLIKIF